MPTETLDPEVDATGSEGEEGSESDDRSGPQNPSQNNRDKKKAAKEEVKNQKKESGEEKKQQGKDKEDPLSQEQKKDKNIGHIPGVGGYAKAARQGKRGQRKDALKTLAKQYLKKRAKQAIVEVIAGTPVGWVIGIVVGIIILIIIIMVIIGGGSEAQQQQDLINAKGPKLTITKSGPTDAVINQVLDYQINVSYPGTAQDIVVTDAIPVGTEFDPSTPAPARFDQATRTVTWSLKETTTPPAASISNVSTSLSLKLKVTADNSFLVNQATGNVIGAGVAPPGGAIPFNGENIPPSTNDCGNPEYASVMKVLPDGTNFGDPQCTFWISDVNGNKIYDKDTLVRMLKERDPDHWSDWFNTIIPCESQYNPNAYNPNSTSGRGAHGHYQMNPGGGNQYDNGKVVWQLQMSNAINYNKLISGSYKYWDARFGCPGHPAL